MKTARTTDETAAKAADQAEPKFTAERSKSIKLPSAVLGLDVSPDARTLYAACMDGGIYVVDVATDAYERIGRHERYASGAVLLRSQGALISAGYDGGLQWHDLASRTTQRKVQAHAFWSWQMAVWNRTPPARP